MTNPVEQALSVVGLAAHLGRGIGRVTADAIVGSRAGLPRAVGDLNTAALSRVMGRNVRSIRVLASDAGTSSRARLVLTGDDVPESVFIKIAAQTAATRLMGELGRLGNTEVRFYSQLAPELPGVPVAYGAAFDRWTGRYLLVLEDLPESVRISRHLAPAVHRSGQPRRRATGQPARNLLGPHEPKRTRAAELALHAVG